jgi:phosphate transport system substrate-binding protein
MESKIVLVGVLVVLVMSAMVLPSSAQAGDILVGQAALPADTGRINWSIADALIALDIVVSNREYDPAMDINGDGQITSLDALMILQAATGDHGIKIAGSTTVLPIADECASAYMENHPDIRIDVSGGGSSYGVKSVANGTVDIGTASRDLKDSEMEAYPNLVTRAIARDGVAIVVNPANPVADLTMADLQGVYTGTITNWVDLGGNNATIVVASREDGSGTRDCFEQAVLKPIGGDITAGAVILDSNDAMRMEVSGNENTIGYLSLGYVSSDIKAVSLNGTLPTIENIGSGDYAISRTLLMITNGTPEADEQSFLDFVLSEDGQQIVEEANFIPVR